MSPKALILGLIFAFIWSSAFTSARVIVSHAPPIGALSLRFFLSGIIALIIAIWLRQNFRLTKNQLQATIIFGICQNTIYLGLNFVLKSCKNFMIFTNRNRHNIIDKAALNICSSQETTIHI